MKNKRLINTIAMTALIFSAQAMADVTTNEKAKPDDWNRSVQMKPMSASKSGQVTDFPYSSDNQLRCWQKGDLIVLENDWKPVDSGKGSLLRNGSKRLHAYDYGETFCIYLGG